MSYDAIVIGGGITGAGVLRDLALRGLKCLLLEKGSPGRGTTVTSTHLIHGGVRYLLYDRLTTHVTCWDSGNILRLARPLLTRLPLLWPVYRGHRHGLETVETLLESYDRFQPLKNGRPHLRLSAAEARRLVPGLTPDGLLGALVFDEWWVDPVTLVEANLTSAREAGAIVLPRARVTRLVLAGNAVTGVEAEDADGRGSVIESRIVVNAAGPWVDRVARLAGIDIPLRRQKGTHLVYDRPLPVLGTATPRCGLLLEAADHARYVFVVPGPDMTLVGPTDVATGADPDSLTADEAEVRYLLASVRRYFPEFPADFARTVTGARPILAQAGSEQLLSREFQVFDHAARDGVAGFVTIGGGKMSDFRLMGEETADAVCRRLGVDAPCLTHRLTLAGEEVHDAPDTPLPPAWMKRLLRAHPRLRQAHAFAHLAVGFNLHAARRLLRPAPPATAEDYTRHYRD